MYTNRLDAFSIIAFLLLRFIIFWKNMAFRKLTKTFNFYKGIFNNLSFNSLF